MSHNNFEIHSPYVKNPSKHLEEVRSRFSNERLKIKKESDFNNKNTLSFKSVDLEDSKASSDSLLKRKVFAFSKKIVGEEIRKFAEVASKEISEVLFDLEKKVDDKLANNNNLDAVLEVKNRVDHVEKTLFEEVSTQNENILNINNALEKTIDEKLEFLNQKIEELSFKLEEIKNLDFEVAEDYKNIINETSDSDLSKEAFSLNLTKSDELEKEEEDREIIKEEEKEKGSELDLNNENKDNFESTLEILSIEGLPDLKKERESDLSFTLNENNVDKNNYVAKKMKNIVKSFEKEGIFFKKNTFISKIKDLSVQDFFNLKEGFTDIPETDKEKIENILVDLMEKVNIDPEEGETIEHFLEKCLALEYE